MLSSTRPTEIYAGYGEPPAGSSQLHSMTLAAPGQGGLRLRLLKLTEGHRMMTKPVSWLLLTAPYMTLASPGWGQLQRAGNKHSSGHRPSHLTRAIFCPSTPGLHRP